MPEVKPKENLTPMEPSKGEPSPLDVPKEKHPGPVTVTRTVQLGNRVTQQEITNAIVGLAQTVILHGREGRKESGDPEYSVGERDGKKYLEYKVVFKDGKADVPGEGAEAQEVEKFVGGYVDRHLNLALKAMVEAGIMLSEEDDEVDETAPA